MRIVEHGEEDSFRTETEMDIGIERVVEKER